MNYVAQILELILVMFLARFNSCYFIQKSVVLSVLHNFITWQVCRNVEVLGKKIKMERFCLKYIVPKHKVVGILDQQLLVDGLALCT